MELQIAGTNTEISPTTQRYIERKLAKLSKHLPDIIDIKVEISEENTRAPEQHYLVRATVSSGVGAAFHGEERAEDLYKAIDRVSAVMTRQLEKHKGKLYDRGRGNPLARGKSGAAGPGAQVTGAIRAERLAVEAMSPAEAVERLEKLGRGFFLFVDAENDELRVLYRREDGDYGLITPELP
jgi:putative sigma-54 modulation protein